ncbi:MAG: hypothetical protein WCJ25_00650 [Candidatus Moraniibacteriota bacterium]
MSFENYRDNSDTTGNTSSGEGIVSAEDTVSEVPESQPANPYARYVRRNGDGFSVLLPGALDTKTGENVGFSTRTCETWEEALAVADKIWKGADELAEKVSLEKTFTKTFYRIDEIPEGGYRVTLPGLYNSKTGYYLGTSNRDFATWKEAKEFYLQVREGKEKLSRNPILEIQTGEREKISFSDFDSFDPQIAPSESSHALPASIEKYLLDEKKRTGSDAGSSTYQETVKEQNWERKLFSFVSSYLENEGAETVKRLEIDHLESLTPKQAVALATEVVIDLTKYKKSDTRKEREARGESTDTKTRADQCTVLQLLHEGQVRRNDERWEGNGVCRNFADSVKAVFEALKKNQTRFNRLRDTYCLFESDENSFAPSRGKKKGDRIGHAWNTFVTVSQEGAADAVIVDATWAERNLETKKAEGLDYTLSRMEPIINAVGRDLREDAPERDEQLRHILSFYLLKMETPGDTGGLVTPEEERQFYATRALDFIIRQGLTHGLPNALVEAIGKEYQTFGEGVDKKEVETLYSILGDHPGMDFSSVFRTYLKDKEFSVYRADDIIFKNDDMQKAAFEELKTRQGFDSFLKESPKFRIRMREALPGLFMGFSPMTKPEDRKELLFLMGKSNFLRWEENRIGTTQESYDEFLAKKRVLLHDMNPARYDDTVADLDDYQLVKKCDAIYKDLKSG